MKMVFSNMYIEKKQIDTSTYNLYSPDSLKYITDSMCCNLTQKIIDLNLLFKVPYFRKLQINLFDEKEKFRNFIYELRGETKSLPEYATGTYDKGMINAFIEKDILVGSPRFLIKSCMLSHELFHIMYMELILKNDYSNRIVWFDEGMAQNFSGEKDELLNDEKFKNFYTKLYEDTKIFPNLNELKHGSAFCNENYNGYNLSYLAVRYLKETLTMDELHCLMSDFDKIRSIGNTILETAFEYYFNQIKRII